ncbi:MAG: hypothetical protein WBC85_14200, partial [Planktotalea sp.]|uniref:hypothetical protein n=1 Tax=Planktotalea sp. TaxID=2029877 RepID=UPI003C714BD9
MVEIIDTTHTSAVSLSSFEDYLLLRGVTHYTETSAAITALGGNDIFVDGSLVALTNVAIDFSASNGVRVTVSEFGSIMNSPNSFLLYNIGTNSVVTNHGIISGGPSLITGADVVILNNGSMTSATANTIRLSGVDGVLNNFGLISSSAGGAVFVSDASRIRNTGDIVGVTYGIDATSTVV